MTHVADYTNSSEHWQTRATAAEAEVERLRTIILDAGLWRKAPCCLCGYNGRGYYQPDTHSCAARSEVKP